MKVQPSVLGAFEDFVTTDTRARTCLADYIAAWMKDGDGLSKCSEDRELFLEAVVLIVAQWIHGPGLLDYYPNLGDPDCRLVSRPVTSAFGSDWIDHRDSQRSLVRSNHSQQVPKRLIKAESKPLTGQPARSKERATSCETPAPTTCPQTVSMLSS